MSFYEVKKAREPSMTNEGLILNSADEKNQIRWQGQRALLLAFWSGRDHLVCENKHGVKCVPVNNDEIYLPPEFTKMSNGYGWVFDKDGNIFYADLKIKTPELVAIINKHMGTK